MERFKYLLKLGLFMVTKEEAKKKIKELVNTFKSNYENYKNLSEADVETKLIEELFIGVLGWTKNDFIKRAKAMRGEKKGHADYAFHINDKIVFFLEVKKVGIHLDKEADKQVISYALSKRIPFAVSTNFERLKIFCVEGQDIIKKKLRVLDNPDDYINRFEDLWLLSKESFEKNQILKIAEDEGRLKKRVSIDKTLLDDLMHIRSLIANDIEKTYSEKYEINEKDEIIQRIIDRLIFIRRCEDIGINPDNISLEEIRRLPDNKAYPKLKDIFKKYNDTYNSGLFAIAKDNDCDKIDINGAIIKKLAYYLYESKDKEYIYNFDWIDADVLGQVYEQYLGKILAQTKSGKAKLKNGQVHRKEQGIYYTPTYIVDYIVKNTVGELLKDKKVDINKIKILDPACGSGSFLIKAFDYMDNALSLKEDAKQYRIDKQGSYSIKTEILKNNIYGVDLDNKAVEITKLNLLLKAAEKERRLPDEIDEHIRPGNSLIEDETIAGLNAFKWVDDFKEGSFDVIIGNPPYGAELNEDERKFISLNYETAKSYKNTALIFIEKSINLLKKGGLLSLIVPKSLAYSQAWKPCRDLVSKDLMKIVDVSKAFEDVLLEQVVFILKKGSNKKKYIIETIDYTNKIEVDKIYINKTDTIIVHPESKEFNLFEKITSKCINMGVISKTSRGLPFQKFISKAKSRNKIFRGNHISRYYLCASDEYLNEINKKNKKIQFLMQPKILSQRIVAHVTKPKDHIIIMSMLDKEGILTLDTIENTIVTDKKYYLETILAIFNSKLASWFAYRYIFANAIRTMDLDNYYVSKLPIPNNIDIKIQEKMLTLINRIIGLNKKLNELGDKNTSETSKLREEIDKTDKEIDELVYNLYGLTEKEKKIIEESLK